MLSSQWILGVENKKACVFGWLLGWPSFHAPHTLEMGERVSFCPAQNPFQIHIFHSWVTFHRCSLSKSILTSFLITTFHSFIFSIIWNIQFTFYRIDCFDLCLLMNSCISFHPSSSGLNFRVISPEPFSCLFWNLSCSSVSDLMLFPHVDLGKHQFSVKSMFALTGDMSDTQHTHMLTLR